MSKYSNINMYVVVLLAAVWVMGLASVAVADSHDQKQDSQQKTSQSQQDSGNKKADSKQNSNSDEQDSDKTSSDSHGDKSGNGGKQSNTKSTVGTQGNKYVLSAQLPSQVMSKSLIDMDVRNDSGKLGTVKNLILDKDYKLVGVVIDMSGSTGLITKTVGLSLDAVENIDPNRGVMMVKVKKDQLQHVRLFKTQHELRKDQRTKDK